jgi:hypothetical protein
MPPLAALSIKAVWLEAEKRLTGHFVNRERREK